MNVAGIRGFYPVVPDAAWVERLLACGVRTVQLRAKHPDRARLRDEVQAAVALGRVSGAQVVINDHWQLALAAGAGHIHLGQGDLDGADAAAIRKSGVGLGISTHTPGELDRALEWPVACVALGPIYETTLKKMVYPPQGLPRLAEWKRRLGCPLVAIGGITLERAPAVLAAGADAIAVVSDVVGHPDPEERTRAWLRLFASREARPTPVAPGALACE